MYLCHDCGFTCETKPDRCPKCGHFTFEWIDSPDVVADPVMGDPFWAMLEDVGDEE